MVLGNSAWLCLILQMLWLFDGVFGIAIDNGVIGQPTIDCGADTVSVWINTKNPFQGKVFVKGESENPQCSGNGNDDHFTHGPTTGGYPTQSSPRTQLPTQSTSGSSCPPCPTCSPPSSPQQSANMHYGRKGLTNMAHITVKMGTCNMRRDRQLNPSGIAVEFTVVISFHEFFITKVDKAYRIRCFYMESEKTVTSEIGVSMPPTTEIFESAAMPLCDYTVRRDRPDGPLARYVQVGESVFHRWECKTDGNFNEMFGMLVHSCHVSDGKGQRVPLLDERGCSEDVVLLGELTYESFMLAYVESHVFKFADRTGVDFDCAIGICVTADGGCQNITPPKCSTSQSRGRRDSDRRESEGPRQEGSMVPEAQWDVHAQRLTVVDLDNGLDAKKLLSLEAGLESLQQPQEVLLTQQGQQSLFQERGPGVSAVRGRPEQFCLSLTAFSILVALTACLATAGLMISGLLLCYRHHRKL